MSTFRIDTRVAASALVALALAGVAPQWAVAQGSGQCPAVWSKLEAAIRAGDPKAAAAAVPDIEDEPHCSAVVPDAKKAVVDLYRKLDDKLATRKAKNEKERAKLLEERMKNLEAALNHWNAYDIQMRLADLQGQMPGKKDHFKIGSALDRAMAGIAELPEAERPPAEEVARLARLAYLHEAWAAVDKTPIQRETDIREIERQLNTKEIPKPIQFDYNKANLTLIGEGQAKDLLVQLKARDWPAIKITGHTDPDGTWEENEVLSLRRAETLRKYLEDNGYPRGRITVAGRGKRDVEAFINKFELRDKPREEVHQVLRRVELRFVN